jgi:hypothetical protein
MYTVSAEKGRYANCIKQIHPLTTTRSDAISVQSTIPMTLRVSVAVAKQKSASSLLPGGRRELPILVPLEMKSIPTTTRFGEDARD